MPPPANVDPSPFSRSSSTSPVDPQERYERIARAAYQRAEQRGFEPGQEIEDWLAAEREIDAQLRNGQ